MRREHLEHVIRAVAQVTGKREIIIIGSQAILGQHPEAPKELLVSDEADVYVLPPSTAEQDADKIAGALGEDSPFHRTHGYWADGVEPRTAVLPEGWEHVLEDRMARTDINEKEKNRLRQAAARDRSEGKHAVQPQTRFRDA